MQPVDAAAAEACVVVTLPDEAASPEDCLLVTPQEPTNLLHQGQPRTDKEKVIDRETELTANQETVHDQRNVEAGRECARRERRIRSRASDLRELKNAVAADAMELLPALPPPESGERQWAALKGYSCIILVIATIAGTTHVLALVVGDLPAVSWWICLGLMYSLALCALYSLNKIVCDNPGYVARSQETCFPVPPELLELLESGEQKVQNIKDDVNDRTYCVRCFVWRPNKGRTGRKSHHCSSCQRCVVDFDHHCAFYGRCVAGHHGSIVESCFSCSTKNANIAHEPSQRYPKGNCFHFIAVPVIGVIGGVIGCVFIVISLTYRLD